MNYADIDASSRLQRVARLLKDKRPHSTLEIAKKTNVCAVNSIVAELRENGMVIDCQRKGDRWYYRMAA